jgi:hypothetical protein
MVLYYGDVSSSASHNHSPDLTTVKKLYRSSIICLTATSPDDLEDWERPTNSACCAPKQELK